MNTDKIESSENYKGSAKCIYYLIPMDFYTVHRDNTDQQKDLGSWSFCPTKIEAESL